MPSPASFQTKRGTAKFSDTAVQFDESFAGYMRSLYRDYWRSELWWHKAVAVGYVLAVLGGIWWAVRTLQRGAGVAIALVGGAVGVLWIVDYIRGFRSRDRIPLEAIEDVSFTRGNTGLTRPRIIITYTDGDATHKRRVNLPSLYTATGEVAYEQAQAAFAKRGF